MLEHYAMQPTVTLTSDQIRFYHDNGYLALESITTADELATLRSAYDRIFSQRAGRDVGDQFDLGGADEDGKDAVLPQILNPAKYAPEFNDGLFRANATAIAKQLLGPDVTPMGDHAIFKPARTAPETPWHQDEAYWGEQVDYNSFSLWMPLQEATLENGCMWFIPGSQRLDVVPHHTIGHDPRVHGLEVDNPPPMDQAVPCPIPAGGCTIHSNRTLHYAGPNRSDIPRRALIMGFGIKPVPHQGPPRNFHWNRQKQTARDARALASQKAPLPTGN
jgi:ectoine hydroxylase-related dioxygenase (phytanoyl-CoA dioxygenase family)